MSHAFVTVAIPFAAARADDVDALLDTMGNPPASRLRTALDATGIVHFMSVLAIRDTAPGRAHLAIEASVDGDAAGAVAAIVAAIGPDLRALFDAAGIDAPRGDLADVVLRHARRLGADWRATLGLGFDGSPGLSVGRIRAEAALADSVLRDHAQVLSAPEPALRKLETVRAALWQAGEKWPFEPAPTPFLRGGRTRTPLIVAGLAAILAAQLLWPLLLLLLPAMWWFGAWPSVLTTLVLLALAGAAAIVHLQRLEATDVPDDTPPDARALAAIEAHENHGAQNLLAARSIMKPGWFRPLMLRIAFGLTLLGVRRVYRPGYLRDIAVIHFARWMRIPGTRTLMFWSNFSDGWESYLEDFISKAGDGMTAVWSNTEGFPRTHLLFGAGAADGDRFRRWARRQQVPARFWYSAYPDLPMQRIRLNAAIRQGIASARSAGEAEDWLACFGSAPRPLFALEKAEIPTLVFGALRRLRFSACLVLTLGEDAAAARAWLRAVAPEVTFGEHAGAAALALALGPGGLRKLGLPADGMATFPVPFLQGMAEPGRARPLGDVGQQAPEHWDWGGDGAADVLLYLYASDAAALAAARARHAAAAEGAGHVVIFARLQAPLPEDGPVYEPFGFADGISQPVIRDTPRARAPRNAGQVVEAGEFVLGYPDNRGYVPPTPTLAAAHDPAGVLAALPPPADAARPDAGTGTPDDRRDLGRNGTFVVVRHLEQDVAALDAWLDATAADLHAGAANPWPGSQAQVRATLAAKLLGRWQDGSSLVRHPHGRHHGPAHEPDNAFGFAHDDPQGLRCPFGAHIRRANPRDSLDSDGPAQLAITNRHRIIRVGRQYAAAEGGGTPGLLFTCLNADIARQFEFVQQTWVMGRSFHGLPDETDPLLGRSAPGGGVACGRVFTVPTHHGPLRLPGLADFVRLRGGGYFFMPGRRTLRFLARMDEAAAPRSR